jgi:hypothetical protein
MFLFIYLTSALSLVCICDGCKKFEYPGINTTSKSNWLLVLININDFIKKMVFFEGSNCQYQATHSTSFSSFCIKNKVKRENLENFNTIVMMFRVFMTNYNRICKILFLFLFFLYICQVRMVFFSYHITNITCDLSYFLSW